MKKSHSMNFLNTESSRWKLSIPAPPVTDQLMRHEKSWIWSSQKSEGIAGKRRGIHRSCCVQWLFADISHWQSQECQLICSSRRDLLDCEKVERLIVTIVHGFKAAILQASQKEKEARKHAKILSEKLQSPRTHQWLMVYMLEKTAERRRKRLYTNPRGQL